ncbi:MAG: asparagine synthase (glutamine-hydrolyzing) [Pseudomonadota bacterium]
MCGIAGILDLQGEREIDARALKRMTDALAHRGPDGEGFFDAPGVGLGHRRLAIIDIERGAQPFTAMDGENIIVFNGEIYNYRDLKRRLAEDGARFRTNSDTEALIEGLARRGADFIEDLRGMFAFAWWSERTQTLTLARDRLGEKPLYYATTPDGFLLFASEIGAIRASRLTPLRHSPAALRDYFFYGYAPDPHSVYEGVKKLAPGSTLTLRRGATPVLRRYWRAEFAIDNDADFEKSKSRLLDLLDDAVSSELVSDVSLGAFLSGGVDSSSIIASMARGGGAVDACTIGFEDAAFDERDYAQRTAARYHVRHHEDVMRLDATSLIDRTAAVYGEPFADPSALPTHEVSAAARRHVKVALSGDGADEIFGGYRRYSFFAREERLRAAAPQFLRSATFGTAGAIYPKLDWAPRPLRLKTTLQSLGEETLAAYARAVSTALPDRLSRMLSRDFLDATRDHDVLAPIRRAAGDERLDALSLAQKIDLETWLPGRMLTKVDRASMAHGLEVRAPFLDCRLVEWALTLPPQFRVGAGVGKRILKAAQKDRLDPDILHRPKQGFSPPVASWLRMKNGPADRLAQSDLWKQSGCFDPAAVETMVAHHRRGVSDYSQELWMLIMFDAFLRHERA